MPNDSVQWIALQHRSGFIEDLSGSSKTSFPGADKRCDQCSLRNQEKLRTSRAGLLILVIDDVDHLA